jgi:capsular exopolysaccharide synthesis family protein
MSYDSGEGKTLTSANMALESARSGMRTLAIDGDMRRGDLHEIFRLPNVYGLSDVLMSNAPLEPDLARGILESGYENLWVLPLGRSESDPAALLSRPRFREMIELLSPRFDAIILDAAPTIGGPDSIFLGEASDGVVIVVNTRRTRLSSLKRSIEELKEGPNVNIYGLIFNRVRLQITSKYNNNYYRQTPTMDPEKLSREIAKPRKNLLGLRSNVIYNKNGEKLYSIAVCAARLGVKKRTVQGWIDTGYLSAERRFMRQWVPESKIIELMQSRQTAAPPPAAEVLHPAPAAARNGTTHAMPDQLRAQRDAILDFANQPDHNADSEI